MDLPAIDQNICGQWTELERNTYQSLPVFLLAKQGSRLPYWSTYKDILKTVPWQPNKGHAMRTVITEMSPVSRQTAFPEELSVTPTADIVMMRERKLDATPKHHDFMSPHFNFQPSFVDFQNHVSENLENVDKQIMVYRDAFHRTQLFAQAPYVYIAGVGLRAAPTGQMNKTGNAAGSKTIAWMQAMATELAGAAEGYLSFLEIHKALSYAEGEVGMYPFQGNAKPTGDGLPLANKYLLTVASEDFNNFVRDAWVTGNRPLGTNIINKEWSGDPWGRVTPRIERFPWRWKLDANLSPTFEKPEITELNPDAEDYGRTKPNPAYTRIQESQVSVAFLMGSNIAEIIELGPPPAEFTKTLSVGDVSRLNWNGKAYFNRNFMVPCMTADGTIGSDPNSFGRYIRVQATGTFGHRAINPFNVLPIIYKRRILN